MPLAATKVFNTKAFLALANAGKENITFEKNQKIFTQGDKADAIFYIQKGMVKITVLSDQGKEAMVGILEVGQFFGENCIEDDHEVRISTTTAMDKCVITSIAKADMIATLHDEPAFSRLFVAYLLNRNGRIEEDRIDQLLNSSERRLARLLLLLADFDAAGSPAPINPNITQTMLAMMIGTTRSRVSCFMNKFRERGFISYDRHNLNVNTALLSTAFGDNPRSQPSRW
jgi:CRP/FNR family cyclic AMP-dependent transcriptional regulator